MSATRLCAAAILMLSGLLATSHALAQKGFYAGGSMGKSNIEDDIATGGLITSGTVDGSSTGFKIFGGYQFNDHFAVEIAYVDLGKAKYSGSYYSNPVRGGEVDIWGFNMSAVGIMPLSSGFAIFGKLGLYAWGANWSDVTGGIPFSSDEYGSDVSFGLGMSYNFTPHIGARFEWERFRAGGGEDAYTGFSNATGRATIDLLSLGLFYKF